MNLGCFVTDKERADSDEEAEEITFTFDDIELSSLGLQLGARVRLAHWSPQLREERIDNSPKVLGQQPS